MVAQDLRTSSRNASGVICTAPSSSQKTETSSDRVFLMIPQRMSKIGPIAKSTKKQEIIQPLWGQDRGSLEIVQT